MPVLSNSIIAQTQDSPQTTIARPTNTNNYLLVSLAILITLGLRLHHQRRRNLRSENSTLFSARKTTSFPNAQTMQSPPSSSALPEKPFRPDSESAGHNVRHEKTISEPFRRATNPDITTYTESSHSSPELTMAQPYSQNQSIAINSHNMGHSGEVTNVPTEPSVTLSHSRRPGSLIYPEPPSPTISMRFPPMTVQTQLPYRPAQEYQFDDIISESPRQNHYFHNEIMFVPSPTEYTSFEALYSKYPPPIYHGPNPTSYTSIASSEISEMETSPFSSSSFSAPHRAPDDFQDVSLPRRRSYTKTLSNGSEMSGEIVVSGAKNEGSGAAQWRRHTRVFGGGICIACEESESRRSTA